MTERMTWEAAFVLIDWAGFLVFSLLTYKLCPNRWWRGEWGEHDASLFGVVLLAASLAVVFLWLFVADIVALWDIVHLDWVSAFPWRGLFLRLIMLTPGIGLLLKLR